MRLAANRVTSDELRVTSTFPGCAVVTCHSYLVTGGLPSLRTVREFLEGLPDAKLLAALDRWRGKGRDDYPVHVLGTPVTSCECRIPSTNPTTGHSSLVTRHS